MALVVEIGDDIEQERLPKSLEKVFAYRFAHSEEKQTLFDTDFGWQAFQKKALAKAAEFDFVVSTDISDFYSRVYHHRLENALQAASRNSDAIKRIDKILSKVSGGPSYGLPVGGNAARLLAEILLNQTDRLMAAQGIQFIRFVDDYFLFCSSREDAQSSLVYLSEVLLRNQGLGLARHKTRVMTRAEFLRSSPLADPVVAESAMESEARRLLKIKLSYDQYSATAEEDYEDLANQLKQFDILSMLAREFSKSRVDEILVRQLVKAIKFLTPNARDSAVESLVSNFETLYPVFPTVAILLRRVIDDVQPQTKERVFSCLRSLIRNGSHIVRVPTNMSFAVRVLARDTSEETDSILVALYQSGNTTMVARRDIILAMTRRNRVYWISDLLKQYATLGPWEKRALIPASYILGDEGDHWRKSMKSQMSKVDVAFMRWVGEKNNGRRWEIPL